MTDLAILEVLAQIDDPDAMLIGHTGWRARGEKNVNRNLRPIRAGSDYPNDTMCFEAASDSADGIRQRCLHPDCTPRPSPCSMRTGSSSRASTPATRPSSTPRIPRNSTRSRARNATGPS